MQEITINIDDQEIKANPDQTVLEAALGHGIEIPNLCYDPRLKPVGACRLCLVEIEGERGLQPSCTRPVAPGMSVKTNTEELRETRKTVLELLLSEHRVSCTSCDKDGECLLQDYAYEYQVDERAFGTPEFPDIEKNYATGNRAIEYDPTKCIKCGRCVRICEEVEMAEALTFRGRASEVQVTTAFDIALNESTCEHCGCCVSTCPTSALYERAAKGKGQVKKLTKVRTTCTYCGVGCQVDLNVNRKSNRIVRVTSEVGCIPNDGNLCVKGRFGFHFVHSSERITKPLVRKPARGDSNGRGSDDGFEEATWEEALSIAAKGLGAVKEEYGSDAIAVISSCRCTNEENYLLQKLARAVFGTNNVDQCAST